MGLKKENVGGGAILVFCTKDVLDKVSEELLWLSWFKSIQLFLCNNIDRIILLHTYIPFWQALHYCKEKKIRRSKIGKPIIQGILRFKGDPSILISKGT